MPRLQEHNTETFSRVADAYAAADYWRADEERAVERYFVNKAGKLLLLGCGAGRTIPYLAKKGYDITALDISPEMVKRARERAKSMERVVVLEGDAAALPFPDVSFDYAFFPFHGLDSVEERYKALHEIQRVLKPGGVLIFTSHNLFFPRAFLRFLLGRRHGRSIYLPESAGEVIQYHTTMRERRALRKLFSHVSVFGRAELQHQGSKELPNWKERLMYILPWIDKSLYFICAR